MKSQLSFLNADTSLADPCGEVLEIEFSSYQLNWPGVLIEKGFSPHFHPTNVMTPYFYFAMALEQDLIWQVTTQDGEQGLHTHPGEIWINPPYTAFTHSIDEPCYFIILAIEDEAFRRASELLSDNIKVQYLNNYNVDDPTIRSIIDLFMIEAQTKSGNGPSYLDQLVKLLANHYLQNYSNYLDIKNRSSKPGVFSNEHFSRIEEYIEQNLGSHISIDELAEIMNWSKFHFLREFRKFKGNTPYQFLTLKRLQRAKVLLQDTSLSITQVALEVGFNDQSHFTRVFKQHFGTTPKSFRSL